MACFETNTRRSPVNFGEHATSRLELLSFARPYISLFLLLRYLCIPRGHNDVFVSSIVVVNGVFLGSMAVRQLPCRREGVGYFPTLPESRGNCG